MILRVISEGDVGSWVDSGISAYRLGGGRDAADIRFADRPPARFGVGDLVVPNTTYWEGVEGKIIDADWDTQTEEWIMTVKFASSIEVGYQIFRDMRTFSEDNLDPVIDVS